LRVLIIRKVVFDFLVKLGKLNWLWLRLLLGLLNDLVCHLRGELRVNGLFGLVLNKFFLLLLRLLLNHLVLMRLLMNLNWLLLELLNLWLNLLGH